MGEEIKSASGATAAGGAPSGQASPKIVLKSVDMNETMREEAYHVARAAFEKYAMEKEIAEYIKKEFDRKYGQTWHCIVGRNFDTSKKWKKKNKKAICCCTMEGSYVTHERNHFLYFYVDSKAVLLFKSG